MKTIFFVLLILGTTFASPVQDIFKNIIAGITGFIHGLNTGGDIHNLNDCVERTEAAVVKIEELIEFIKGGISDISKIFQMLSKVCESLKQIVATLRPCIKITEDFNNVIEKLKKIDFNKFLKELLNKAFALYGLIAEAIGAIGEGKFKKFGECVGGILYKLFLTDTFVRQ